MSADEQVWPAGQGPQVALRDVDYIYGYGPFRVVALAHVNATITGPTICGLLGRNGSGKTTLMSLMAGLRVPTGGQISITVPGEPDQWATQRVLYASSHCNDGSMFKVEDFLQLYASMRPHWSQDHADRLLETFKLPRKRRLRSLSQGQFAAVEFIVAMASHAEVTLLDEVYLGMDAIYRDLMVQELVADFAEHPRTIIFATHYIEEFERMFDDVMIIDHARVVLHNDADELRKGGKSIKEVFLETVEKGAYDA